MERLQDIEIWWRLRRLRLFRVDPVQARMWATLLAVLIGIGLTLAGGYIAVAQITATMGVFVNVHAYNQSVTQDRAVVITIAGIVALSLVGLALWRRRRARFYQETIGVSPGHPLAEVWLLICGAVLVMLAALLFCVSYLTYLPVEGPTWRHL